MYGIQTKRYWRKQHLTLYVYRTSFNLYWTAYKATSSWLKSAKVLFSLPLRKSVSKLIASQHICALATEGIVMHYKWISISCTSGTEIQRNRNLVFERTVHFCQKHGRKYVFFFPGTKPYSTTKQTNLWLWTKKKTDVSNVPHMKRNTITIITTKIQGGTAPTSCGSKKLPGKTVAIFNNPYTVCKYIQLHYKNYFHSIRRGDFHLYPLKVLFNETSGINSDCDFRVTSGTSYARIGFLHATSTSSQPPQVALLFQQQEISSNEGKLNKHDKPRSTVFNTWNFSSSSIV